MDSYALLYNFMGIYPNAILFCYCFLTVFQIRGSLTDKLFLCCTFETRKLKALLKYKPEH